MELWVFWVKIALITIVAVTITRLSRGRSKALRAMAWGTAVLLFAFIVLCIYDQQGRNSELAASPNGKYVARVMIGYGMLDGPDSAVVIRPKGRLEWHRVYRGFGYMQDDRPAYPDVHWKDDYHLIMTYHGEESHRPLCAKYFETVQIECNAETW